MADDLADLLLAGERAAFHGRPADGVDPLRRAVETAAAHDLLAEASGASWLLGVCLGATGRYGAALDVLDPLVAGDDDDQARVLASLASATVASVHRQLGRHSVAQGYDERALAGSQGQGEAGFDALLGLAADAVGLGDAAGADLRLGEATALVGERLDWWRQRVRLDWVGAEIALMTERPGAAVTRAASAVDLAERWDAPRHVAKGLLFLGIARLQTGQVAEATGALRRAGLLAERLGTLPLQWPVRALLGALLHEDDPTGSAASLESARTAVRAIAADLPHDLRADWLGRPDVEALLAE